MLFLSPRCLGRGGASHRRRWSLRLSVGGVPPSWRPSGACLGLGSRLLLLASERCRGFHHTGAASFPLPVGNVLGGGARRPRSLEASAAPGSGWARAHRQPARARARATGTRGAGWPRAPRGRERVPRRPGAVPLRAGMLLGCWARRQGPWRLPVAGAREAQAPAPRARRAWGWPAWGSAPGWRRSPEASADGRSPPALPPGSRGVNPGQGAPGGAQGDGPRAGHAPAGLQGCDHRGSTPGGHGRVACLGETLAARGGCRDRPDLGVAHAGRRRGRAADRRAPPQRGGAPMGPARRAASRSEPASCAAHRGVRAIAAGRCTRPRQVPPGCRCPLGPRDRRASPRACQPGPGHGVSPVGGAARTRLLGPQRGGPAPTVVALGGQRPGEPRATRPRCRDEPAGVGCGWPLPDAWVAVTLPGPPGAQGGHRSARLWGNRRDGHGLVVDLHADQAGARRRQGGPPRVLGCWGDIKRHWRWAAHPGDSGGQPPAIGSHYVSASLERRRSA
jgi:hypothetical protein